jgi:peptidoglycan-associated lipoprotein
MLILSVIVLSGGCGTQGSHDVDLEHAPIAAPARSGDTADLRAEAEDTSRLAHQDPAPHSPNAEGDHLTTTRPASESKERFAGSLSGFAKSDPQERIADPVMVAKQDVGQKEHDALKRNLANIYFRLDDWTIPPEGKQSLAETAEYLIKNRQAKVVIEGHCDERGTREYNLVLGEKRALQTVRYLETLGLKNRTKIISYGKERPVCLDPSEGCYWKNRRAEIIVIDESK